MTRAHRGRAIRRQPVLAACRGVDVLTVDDMPIDAFHWWAHLLGQVARRVPKESPGSHDAPPREALS
ncbi:MULTISPECIES: hypothetical protein [unclassified Streptomyces]|uniref:hypothetical protein n=1 Tax=unclassified Streptomyces TaxID=2593676 RepID=UPI0036E13191